MASTLDLLKLPLKIKTLELIGQYSQVSAISGLEYWSGVVE